MLLLSIAYVLDKGDYLKLMEGEHGQGEPETVK